MKGIKTELNQESASLQDQYLTMQRSLFAKFTNSLSGFVLISCSFEAFYAISQMNLARFARLVVALSFSLGSRKFFGIAGKNVDMMNALFYIVWCLFDELAKSINKQLDQGQPIDTLYLGYTYAYMDRKIAEKMPDMRYKALYSLCIMIIRLMINPPGSFNIFLRQLVIVGFVLYIDMNHDNDQKELFYSYSSSKDQLKRFKDLVVQDIPDSIAILSHDLQKTLFMNNPFKTLIGGETTGPIKYCLNNFYIQDTSESIRQLGDSRKSLMTPKKMLLDYLVNFNAIKENSVCSKQTFNLVYDTTKNFFQTSSDGSPQSIAEPSERIFEAKAFPIVWDEQPSIALIMHDITQQHTILSLKIADANKDRVLATVSHELRTPLNGMLGMIQIMQKRVHDQEMQHYLSICKNSGNLLLGLVNSILDLNQIRLNKLKLNPEKIDLFELLNDIYCMFEFQCQQKKLDFKLDIHPSTPRFILTDKNRLSQIFINLVGNALKFTSDGEIKISCHKSPIEGYVNLSIKDTGIGIRESDKEKLFKMFGRIEPSDHLKKRLNNHGVGLGLTISNNLAKLLSGDYTETGNIKVKSVYGKGSTFSFAISEVLSEEIFDVSTVMDDSPKSPYWIENEQLKKIEKLPSLVNKTSIRPAEQEEGNTPKASTKASSGITKQSLTKKLTGSFGSNLRDSFTSSLLSGHLNRYSKKNTENPTRILIVDDNPFNIVVAEQLIASYGFNLFIASNFFLKSTKMTLIFCSAFFGPQCFEFYPLQRSKLSLNLSSTAVHPRYGTCSNERVKVETALSAQAAIKIITENSYSSDAIQMVFMDCQMPVMDGYDATRVLKKLMKEKKIPEVPIVALTANNSVADKKKCLDVGMCEHLTKPLTDVDLKRILKKYVSQEC